MSKQKGSISIIRYARLEKLNKLMLQGGYTNNELATRFGVSQAAILQDKAFIRKHFWAAQANEETAALRQQRVRELEHLKRLALESYYRSRQDKEEITTRFDKKACEECNGTGKLPKCKCINCDGLGFVNEEVVQRKVSGQAGDSSFLQTAKACVVEMIKLEGLQIEPEVHYRHVVEGKVAHTLSIEEQYKDVDPELVINAKVALALLEDATGRGKKRDDDDIIEGKIVE